MAAPTNCYVKLVPLLLCCLIGLTAARELTKGGDAGASAGAPDAILDKVAAMAGKSIAEISETTDSEDDGKIYVCERREPEPQPDGAEPPDGGPPDGAEGARGSWWKNFISPEDQCKIACTASAVVAGASCTVASNEERTVDEILIDCFNGISDAATSCQDCPDTLCFFNAVKNIVKPICKYNVCDQFSGDPATKCNEVCDVCQSKK